MVYFSIQNTPPATVWAIFLIALLVPTASAPVLYSQPTDARGGPVSTNNSSNTAFPPSIAFDNFTLSSAAHVDDISWVGEYGNGTPTLVNFTVQIYNDQSNLPGGSIFSTNVTSFNETSLGTDALGLPYFSYDAAGFSTPTLSAGTPYWMSIVATTAGGLPLRYWETGTGGDLRSVVTFPGGSIVEGTDLAFSLKGNSAVPEPGAFGLVLLGAAVIGFSKHGTLRRTHKRRHLSL